MKGRDWSPGARKEAAAVIQGQDLGRPEQGQGGQGGQDRRRQMHRAGRNPGGSPRSRKGQAQCGQQPLPEPEKVLKGEDPSCPVEWNM